MTGAAPPVFARYAAWYDAFNADKDTAAEVDDLLRQVVRHGGRTGRWLDVGCGTGRHVAELVRRGTLAEGVDRSPEMIARARAAHPGLPFHVGAAQDFRLDGGRDVVSLLFHVVSYQLTDDAVRGALANAAAHLAPGGLVLFDFWNADALATDPPRRRVREARVDGRPLFRIATPSPLTVDGVLRVRFEFRRDAPDGPLEDAETHELVPRTGAQYEDLARSAGLVPRACTAWGQDRPLGRGDWYGFLVASRREA